MLSAWTQHIKDPVEKKNFEEYVKGSKQIMERLQAILNTLETSLERTEQSADVFEDPNWAYKQAYMNGCRAMLHRVKLITDLTPIQEQK